MRFTLTACALWLTLAATPAFAQEAAIRKNLPERLPNLPKIDEVTKTPIPGLWEVRIGSEIFYTDEQGQFLVQGEMIDLRARANLTRQRLDKLAAFDFDKLPLK
ncbi:MAG: disulfide isomerase DsbC N-terminal domain-containing protein, partial [Rubrivivax sp.]